jgi:hypothetical protein
MRRKRLPASAFDAGPAVGLLPRMCACGQHVHGGRCEAGCPAGPTVPPIVHEALSEPGQPLDVATRAFMERRLGPATEPVSAAMAGRVLPGPPSGGSAARDLSRVRVHTDSPAAASASAVGARAYTVGQDIIFGAGQYQPRTDAGRRLLAHELAHVVQQQRTGFLGIQRQPAGAAQPAVPTEADFREFVLGQIHVLDRAAEHDRRDGPVAPADLQRRLAGWKRMVEGGAEMIHTSLNDDPALTEDLRRAYRAAVRTLLTGADPLQTLHELYQANRELIHEWGWPPGIADRTATELLDTVPERERQRIRVVTTKITIAGLGNLFAAGATPVQVPQGAAVRFAGGVSARLRPGLANVAGVLTTDMGALEVNSTITLALDLERFGGNFAAYRFSYVEHRPQRGPRTQEILIERLGSIGMEGVPPSQVAAAQARFDQHGFRRGGGWTDAQFHELLGAIGEIPDAVLGPLRGLALERRPAHPALRDRCGEYEVATHTITMFDCAFDPSLTRFGMPGSGVSSVAVQSITHELGHAVDLLPLRQAWGRLEQEQAVLRTAFRQFENPPGSNRYQFPNTEQARWNLLQGNIRAAERARDQARARSGARWRLDPATGVHRPLQGPAGAEGNAFRLAAERDHGTRVTRYSDESWQEYFAEAYSLYMTDPEALRRLRPNVYAYFVANLPP